jgi:hypothetical protein
MFIHRSHSLVAIRHSSDGRNLADVTRRPAGSRGTHAGDPVKIESGMLTIPVWQRGLNTPGGA